MWLRGWVGVVSAAAVLGFGGGAQAQQALSVEDALRAAVDFSPELKASLLEIRRAELGVVEADGDFITSFSGDLGLTTTTTPQGGVNGALFGESAKITQDSISSSMSLTRRFGPGTQLRAVLDASRSLTTIEGAEEQDPNVGLTLRLELSQPWLQGFGRDVNEANIERFKAQRTGSQATALRTANSLLLETLTAYWELWYAQRSLEISEQALEVAREQLEVGQGRVSAGTVAESELLPLLTEEASILEEVQAAQATVTSQAIALSRLLGLADGAERSLRVEATAPTLPGEVMDEGQLYTLIQANAPTLEALRVERRTTELDRVQAEDQNQMQLNTTAWIQSNGLGTNMVEAGEQFGSLEATGAFVGLELNLPVSRRATRAALSRARLAQEGVELRYQAELQRLKEEADQRHNTLATSYTRLELVERTAALARRSTQAQRERFEAGTGTALEVAQVLQSQRRAELRFTRLLLDITLEHLAVHNLSGELAERLGVDLDLE